MESKQSVLSYTPAMNGKNYDGDKERISAWSVVVADPKALKADGGMRELITVRCWTSRKSDGASPVYASVWIWSEHHGAGHGRANGYMGYHKASAAIQVALQSAGVKLAQPIDGHGDSAIECALRAIAAHLGFAQCLVLRP